MKALTRLILCGATLLGGAAAAAEETPAMALTWPDRAPVYNIYVSNEAEWPNETNPGGYLGKGVDLTTPEGIEQTRRRLRRRAEEYLAHMATTGAQGMIVWDVCGSRHRHMKYVGDPRVLPEYSPGFNRIVDDFFAVFRAADKRTGVNIRPIRIDRDADGAWRKAYYAADEAERIAAELSARIRYARERWGCTLFFLSDNYCLVGEADGERQKAPLPTGVIATLHREHPACLIIPEHVAAEAYYAYAAPFTQGAPTPAAVRETLPRAFSVVSVGSLRKPEIVRRWDALVGAVQAGDVLLDMLGNTTTVKTLTDAASYRGEALPAGLAAATAVRSKDPAVRYRGLLAIAAESETRPEPEIVRTLVTMATADPDRAVRLAAIRALGAAAVTRHYAEEASDALTRLIKQERTTEQVYFATEALVGCGEEGVAALRSLTAENLHPFTRQAALYGLKEAGAAEQIIPFLDNPLFEVRSQAIRMLGEAPVPEAFDHLLAVLERREHWRFKAAALEGLRKLGDPRALPAIETLLQRDTLRPKLRRAAREAQEALQAAEPR